jgi:hypothetical protein
MQPAKDKIRGVTLPRTLSILIQGVTRSGNDKEFASPAALAGRIFHRGRRLRDNNLIFRRPLAAAACRSR